MMEDHKENKKEAILVIINCLIVVSPPSITSEWIVMTNARVFHNNDIHDNKM